MLDLQGLFHQLMKTTRWVEFDALASKSSQLQYVWNTTQHKRM